MYNGDKAGDIRRLDDTHRMIPALLIPLAAFILQWFFWDTIRPYVWFLFYPAVFFSSRVGGMRGGLVVTAFSTLIVWWFFIPVRYSFALEAPAQLFSIGIFAGMGVLFSITHERLRKANRRTATALTAVNAAKEHLEERISERTADLVRISETLRESEEKYRLIADNADDWVYWIGPDGNLRYISPSCERVTGYSIAEFNNHTQLITEIVHPEDRETLDRHSVRTREENKPDYQEFRIITKTGEVRWISHSCCPIYSSNGQSVGRRGTNRNITERKLAEEKLMASEKRLREAQEMAHLGYWLWNVKSGEVEWSEEVFKIFCLDPEEFTPHIDKILALSPWPEEHQRNNELINRAVETHSPGSYEQKFLRPDNSIGHYYSTFQGNYDENGDLVTIVGTVFDITDRKRAEEALRKHSERLNNMHLIDQAILHAVDSPETIAQTALQHLRNQIHCQCASVGILDPEKKRARILAAEINGETLTQTREYLAESAIGNLDILRQGKAEIMEDTSGLTSPPAVAQIFQGEEIRSSINVPLLSERGLIGALNIGWKTPRIITPEEHEIAGEVAGQIAIAIEQARLLQKTKRHAAELEQRVNERTVQLEAANRELEAFSYSVSHDLRAPLRAIDGYTRLLIQNYESRLNAEGKRFCSVISDSAKNMGKLIDDLLSFSRIGRAALRPSEVDMATMARSIFSELTTPEERERIDFNVGPLPHAMVDPSLFRHIWMNLLGNAVKFSSKNERAMINISAVNNESETVYTVRDNGAGFDMRYADKLFGVFQRLHSMREFDGTGVGLAIVQRIISRHGGRVWAEGEVGKGASFYFTTAE